jgi:hypothetical protein
MSVTADNSGTQFYSDAVDLYNSASGTWSTARLSVGRALLAATSVGNMAIFAGGLTGNCSFAVCDCIAGLYWSCCVCMRRFACCLLVFALQQVAI